MSYGAGQAIPDPDQNGMPSPSEFVENANTAEAAMPSTPENAAGLQAPETASTTPATPAQPAPAAPQGPQPQPENAMGLGGGAPQIARYLQGADAAPRQVVQALETKVDPQNTMDQNERSMRTIEAAAQDSPDVAWGVMQYYRANYNALRAATAVSLAKGSNPEVVSQNFNAAYSYLPDGNKVTMAPAKSGGYVIQVHTLDGASQSYNVTPEQLNQFVHPGNKEGAFDNLVRPDTPDQVNQVFSQLQGSAGQAVENLQKTGAAPNQPTTPATPYGGQTTPLPTGTQTGAMTVGKAGTNSFEPNAKPAPERPVEDPFAGFSPQDVTRARYMFNGSLPQMLNYLTQNAQKNQELASKESSARGRGVEAAQARATAQANAPLKQGTDTAEARNAREQSRNDTRRTVEYDKTVSAIQRDLVKQINPATNRNWTPQEAMQEALGEVKSRGMQRPSPQQAAEPTEIGAGGTTAKPQPANAGGGNAPATPRAGTQVATPQSAQSAQPGQTAPVPAGRRAISPNRRGAEQLPANVVDSLEEGMGTKLANGQVWTLKNGQPVQLQ